METNEMLNNSHISVEFRPYGTFHISGSDHDDQNNLPAFYTQNKRGIKKQWEILKSQFNDNTTFHDVVVILHDNGAKVHSWCSMD